MDLLMQPIVSHPLFGITLSVLTYVLCTALYRKTNTALLSPLPLTILIVCTFLMVFRIPFDEYDAGAQFITLMLAPATVVLALPLYENLSLIKENAAVILISITIGTISSIISVFLLCRTFELDQVLTVSLIPKSVTTAIAVDISASMQGIRAVTVVAVILSGVLGAVIGPTLCRLFRIQSSVAVGLAMGTAAHAVGASKAMEIGEKEAAMSGLAIGIAGLLTVVSAPILVALLTAIWQ